MTSLLTRTLKAGDIGDDVYGCKRAVARYLGGDHLKELEENDLSVRRTYGPFFQKQVDEARAGLKLAKKKSVDEPMWKALVSHKAPDARALALMNSYIDNHPNLQIVYPHTQESRSTVCQGLHPTAGILGNWGIDFCCPGGTPIVAVEDAKIQKLSGHSPYEGDLGGAGIFGWSMYYRTRDGYVYFCTHMGDRVQGLNVGDSVQAGELIGHVGHWPHNEGRSHTHLGCTSPLGATDAKKRITTVSKAPRV